MGIRVFYENEKGRILEFSKLTGIRLTAIDSISGNTIDLSESTVDGQIGSTLTGYSVQAKDITLEGRYHYDAGVRRQILATILPGVNAKLRYVNEEEGVDVYWEAAPKKTPIISLNPVWQSFQVTLRLTCPYPRKTKESSYGFQTKKSMFKFPRSYSNTVPFKITTLEATPLITIDNEGDLDSGFIVRMKANADGITSPYVTNVDTQETLRFNGLTLSAGNILEICTRPNEKYAHLITKEGSSNVFGAMDYNSSFFQLKPGKNYLRAGASTNEAQLETTLVFNEVTAGV